VRRSAAPAVSLRYADPDSVTLLAFRIPVHDTVQWTPVCAKSGLRCVHWPRPPLTLVVVLSLGLGISANTAIFCLLQQIILSSLPVERPEELVLLNSPGELKSGRRATDNCGGEDAAFQLSGIPRLREAPARGCHSRGFRRIGANLSFQNQTVSGGAMLVSGRYFSVLGVRPMLGRVIAPEDDVHGGGNPVAALGYGY
jgi:hypothetical protein